jgi:hypothetical protein
VLGLAASEAFSQSRRATSPKVIGVFGALDYHGDSGDVTGLEVIIYSTRSGSMAAVLIAEGEPQVPIFVPISIDGPKLTFELRVGNEIRRYEGTIRSDGLYGRFDNGSFSDRADGRFLLKRARKSGEDAAAQWLRAAALHVRLAVVSGDAETILSYVDETGIACVDVVIEKARVARDLRDQESWLHAYLFSAEAFEAKHKDSHPVALGRFFREVADAEPVVSFSTSDASGDIASGCVHFRSSRFEFSPELCFFRKNGDWWLTKSLYNCE